MQALVHLLIFFGALQAYFFGFLLVSNRNRKPYEWWLLLLLMSLGTMQILHFLRWEGYLENYMPVFLRARFLFPALIGPAFYLFSRSIASKSITNKILIFSFLPAFINCILLSPYLFQPSEVKIHYALHMLYPVNYYLIYIIARLSLLTFSCLAFFTVVRNEQQLTWLKKMSAFLIIHSLILIIINLIDFVFYEIVSYYYINLINTLLIFLLGFFTIRYGRMYQGQENRRRQRDHYQKSGLSEATAGALLARLDQMMT
ncbi:MAG: hypothetical protein WBA74_13660, partial [Cyclobacteriaceae bacterium]